MKLDISKEQCLRLAEREGDSEVGAGLLARDPEICPHWPQCGCGTQSGPHTCEVARTTEAGESR